MLFVHLFVYFARVNVCILTLPLGVSSWMGFCLWRSLDFSILPIFKLRQSRKLPDLKRNGPIKYLFGLNS